MVFESLVVDLMNRYLGDFIENLDRSQLKIGIWGGDIVLNNLFIKDSALDDLDLPVKVLHGILGKLTLKIPWKNLYTEPVVANLDGLYIVAVPKTSIKYNDEKEKKAEQDAKQKELARIEEAKKQEAAKKKPKEPQQDSFAEKMATQVIKNLQVTVSNIHVRYEDHFTNPQRPFSIGVTLKGLSFQTTDGYWKPMIIKETVDKIFKLIKLDGLALYWNSFTKSYLNMDRQEILHMLKKNISVPGSKTDYQYLLEPISSSVQLRMHTKPEKDEFSIPKMLLNVVFEEIVFGLQRQQYLDIMELLESFERMAISAKYRKYRPMVTEKRGHAKNWWHFAYNCVLEERVRRRRKMWSWENIRRHRQMVNSYKAAYKKKLVNKKVPADVQAILDGCEKDLSVFNITLARQSAEMEVKKEGARKAKGDGGGGWFSGWWGSGKKEETTEALEIGEQFQQLMTQEEKNKLYDAIGYQENAVDPTLPPDFVANKLNFQLHNLSVTLKDPQAIKTVGGGQVVKLELKDVSATIAQRPAADAVRIDARMDRLQVLGVPVGGSVPVMVTSQTQSASMALLALMFETNPPDGLCDQRVKLNSQPLEIIYDAGTINQVADFFKPPESVYLKQLQAAAMMKFELMKEQTASGLSHAIEQHKYTDINVDLQPCHIVIPEKGLYKRDSSSMLVVDLGNLRVLSEKQDRTVVSPKSSEALSFDEVMKKAYDKFKISLSSVQVLYAAPGQDWKAARRSSASPMHVIRPITLKVDLEKSILIDPKLPKMRISGEMAELAVTVSDARLQELIALVQSIPLPESTPALPEDETMDPDAIDIEHVTMAADPDALIRKLAVPSTDGGSSDEEFFDAAEDLPRLRRAMTQQSSQDYVNSIDLDLKFEIKEINLQLAQRYPNGVDVPIIKIVVDSLGTGLMMRTFDMSASAYLGGIYIQHCEFKATEPIQAWLSQGKVLDGGPLINIVNTPGGDANTKLLMVDYLKANKKAPEFATTYNSTEQKIKVHFTSLEVLLHQEALLHIMEFAQKLVPPSTVEPPKRLSVTSQSVTKATKDVDKPARPRKERPRPAVEVIDLAVEATLDVFALGVCTQFQLITDIRIKGLDAKVSLTKSKTDVKASLKDICVFDPTPGALYPKILSIEGKEVFSVDIGVYNGATSGSNYANMAAVDTSVHFDSGCMKIVFLNKFVSELLGFLNQFQAAKDKMAEAGSAAAEAAAAAAQEFSAKAPRVKLNIHLNAPIIIVPQKSTSTNALVVDLGDLTLSNNFSIAPGKSADGTPAVLDNMNIKLTSLKISRTVIKNLAVTAECLMLEPVCVSVDIGRNLSATWYHGHPDISISGRVDAFQVAISQGDFTMMMSLLNENLTEGATPPHTQHALPAPGTTAGETQIVAETVSTVHTGLDGGPTSPVSPTTGPHTTLQLSFTLQTINATLYTGNSNLGSGISPRRKEESLGCFELQLISVHATMRSDTSMEAAVILHNMVLEDTRPGMNKGITRGLVLRMIERSNKTVSKDANMIDLNYSQDKQQNKKMTVNVNGLFICVCPEYLMAIADFFVKGLPAAPEAVTPKPADTLQSQAQVSTSAPAAPAAPPGAGEMVITLTVEQPEIVMVENSMKMDTDALILNTQVYFMMRLSPEHQSMMGSIRALQVVSCVYALEKREKTKQPILAPTDIYLNTNAPGGKNMHADITVTDIIMTISPATIRCITATLSSLSPQKTEDGEDSKEDVPDDLWLVKKVQERDFWFLKIAFPERRKAGEDAEKKLLGMLEEEVLETRGEQLMLTVNHIIVKLEGGVGKRTVPLLITEMTLRAEVRDWSSKLYVSSDLSMEVAYYNERLAVWEPLVEPVEDAEKKAYRPWELNLEVVQNDLFSLDDEEIDSPTLPPPKMSISIRSTDVLQTTISKTCLDVLNNLGKAFGDAYNLVELGEKTDEVVAPYLIHNDSGLVITIKLDDTFKVPSQAANNHVGLMPEDRLLLYNKDSDTKTVERSVIRTTNTDQRRVIVLILEEFGATRELSIVRAERRAFSINQRSYPGDTWTLVADMQAKVGCKELTLRSMLQIHNHLTHGIEVYYKLGDDCKGRCGEMTPDGKLNVPLEAVYAAPYELYFKVMHSDFGESKVPLLWRELRDGSGNSVICCEAKDSSKLPFYFNVKTEVENILYENTGETTAQMYVLHLYPSAVFRNLLPMAVSYMVEGAADVVTVQGGATSPLANARIGTTSIEVKISNYQDKEWTVRHTIEETLEPLTVWTFETNDGSIRQTMDLGLHTTGDPGYQQLSLYCPYWMINKTARPLTYKAGDDFTVQHNADEKGIVLFSFKSKSFFGKKKASLKVGDSDWSDKFSLDTVGSAGTVSCKFHEGYNYEVGIKITLSSSGLTKIVMFTPYFMLVNEATFTITCEEAVANPCSCDVPPGECVPFWPVQTSKKMQMKVTIKESGLETMPFYFTEAHTTLLPIDHKFGGVNVEVQVMESAIFIKFQQYSTGMASALLINYTENAPIEYMQRDVPKDSMHNLSPGEMVLYTWQDAIGKRELLWSCGEQKEHKDDLVKDGIGEFFYDSDTKIYWVSFLDGMQRILLFTEDLALATMAQQAGELEQVDQEINLSIQGMGLSLVNNLQEQEIAYMAITSSGVVWEVGKKKRFKALKNKQSVAIETAYQQYENELAVGRRPRARQSIDKMEVDFTATKMLMLKPNKGTLQRVFQTGVWVQYRTSPHQVQFHAKIHHLQLDNQLPEAIFPTVLAPVPPPKSVAAESVPKPFTEVSVMIRKRDFNSVLQFKYCKVLVQELSVKVDQGFLNGLISLFASEPTTEEQEAELFKADCKVIDTKLLDDASQSSSNEQKHYYDILHFSPLKIHLSFSMYAGSDKEDNKAPAQLSSNVLNLFMQSVGVVLSDIQDVIFKLGYFERNYSFYNQNQLMSQITRHYSQQAIKQMYVLVLGLDVLGNPFGVIRGLAEGIEDLFYEPYQGAIQGPEEFAEGLALGVRSLFGHAVGGAAGAVSRMTGALGKGIATLTMDDEYQRKRREQMAKRPTDLKEGLARGGKGLVMGVVDGVSGIVLRPMEGAKQEGVEGFFKGMGKGLVGAFTRPASGVIDFASTTFEGVKRATEVGDEVRRLRPPRFLHSDGIVRPYKYQEAWGNMTLHDTEKGKYIETDTYLGHVVLTKDGKNVLLVTDKRVLFTSKGEIFGHWDCDWAYTWAELKEPPTLTSKGLQILLKEKQKKSFFSTGTVGKLVPIQDKTVGEWILTRIQAAMAKAN